MSKKSETRKKDLPKLGITCTDSRCDQQLHSFKPKQHMTPPEIGNCRSCGAGGLIDWQRIHQRDPHDFDYLRDALDKELIRHEFWRIRIPDYVRELAENPRKPLAEMLERSVRQRIWRPASKIFRDGTQTPFPHSPAARIYHYGQHATGTCCRACLAYWHGIAAEVPLGERDLGYAVDLVSRYVEERL
jgi:hypothetical protein